ncbi:MAG: hypothetical protein Kow00117_05670 [Phototrophicales bacterium]
MANTTGKNLDDFIVRPAVKADAFAIGRLWEKLVAYHHELDPNLPQASQDGSAFYCQHIQAQLENPYSHVLVAEYDQQVIGYVFGVIIHEMPEMFLQDPGGFLADIFIEEQYRGYGIGRQLVLALQDWFKSRGVSHMEWYVATQNIAARAFWQVIGGDEVMIRMQVRL